MSATDLIRADLAKMQVERRGPGRPEGVELIELGI
jgi:hypothetical protein